MAFTKTIGIIQFELDKLQHVGKRYDSIHQNIKSGMRHLKCNSNEETPDCGRRVMVRLEQFWNLNINHSYGLSADVYTDVQIKGVSFLILRTKFWKCIQNDPSGRYNWLYMSVSPKENTGTNAVLNEKWIVLYIPFFPYIFSALCIYETCSVLRKLLYMLQWIFLPIL